MPVCKHCHKRIPDTVDVCPHCCQIVNGGSADSDSSGYVPSYTQAYTSPYAQDHSCMCGEEHTKSYGADSFNVTAPTRSGNTSSFEHDCICDEAHAENNPRPVSFYHETQASPSFTPPPAQSMNDVREAVKIIVALVLLFVFWPVGIILIATNKLLPKRVKFVIIAVSLAIALLSGLSSFIPFVTEFFN